MNSKLPFTSLSVQVSRKRTRADYRAVYQYFQKNGLAEKESGQWNSQDTAKEKRNTNSKDGKALKAASKTQGQSKIKQFFQIQKCKSENCSRRSILDNEDKFVQCCFCGDSFHLECQDLQSKPDNEFSCGTCQIQVLSQKRLRTNEGVVLVRPPKCSDCNKIMKEDTKKQCLKCLQFSHKKCFESVAQDHMFCCNCSVKFTKTADSLFPFKVQSKQRPVQTQVASQKISNFFSHQKNRSLSKFHVVGLQDHTQDQSFTLNKSKKTKKRSVSLTIKKKNYNFKLAESYDKNTEVEIHDSFKRSFFVKEMKYAISLVYDSPDCPITLNNTQTEKIQTINRENTKALEELRVRERSGILPPLIIKHDSTQGLYVEAAQDLDDLTLLCEYSGEVRTFRQTLFDSNDSIMELIDSGDADTSIVIAPEKFSNAGRFFNSVKSNDIASKRKQNLRSMRCQHEGKVCVLIYTVRPVKKGESLLYDYNESGKNNYPTDDFI